MNMNGSGRYKNFFSLTYCSEMLILVKLDSKSGSESHSNSTTFWLHTELWLLIFFNYKFKWSFEYQCPFRFIQCTKFNIRILFSSVRFCCLYAHGHGNAMNSGIFLIMEYFRSSHFNDVRFTILISFLIRNDSLVCNWNVLGIRSVKHSRWCWVLFYIQFSSQKTNRCYR